MGADDPAGDREGPGEVTGLAYTGPASRCSRTAASRLGLDWVLQPKVDGCYVQVTCGEDGRIVRLISRTGREYDSANARSLLGCRIMPGFAILAGELEDHTPIGVRLARERGYPVVHLFDALVLSDGRSLINEPYWERRKALCTEWYANAKAPDVPPERDRDTGRYLPAIPRGWSRAPLLPLHPVRRFDALWQDEVEAGLCEGLVAVNTRAPIGPQRAKRKVKPYDSVDCIVLEDLGNVLVVRSFCGTFRVQWYEAWQRRSGEARWLLPHG